MSTDKPRLVTDGDDRPLTTLKARLREALFRANLSAREASRRAGFTVSYIGDILEGRSQRPEIGRILKLSEELRFPVDDILAGNVSDSAYAAPIPQIATRPAEQPKMPLFAARFSIDSMFLPVAATPIGKVDTLPALADVQGSYAFLVPNNVNAPRYSAGETVYISPVAMVAPGDFVFARLEDGRAGVARFVSLGSAEVTLETLATGLPEVSAMKDVTSLHRIVGSTS